METNEMFPKGWLKEAQAGPTKTDKETAKKLLSFVLLKIKSFTDDVPWNIYLEYIPPGFLVLLDSVPLEKTEGGIYAYLSFAEENDISLESSESGIARECLFNLFYVKCELEKYLASETQIIRLDYILDSIFTAGESLATLDMMHEIKAILSGPENELSPSYATVLTEKIREAMFGGVMTGGRATARMYKVTEKDKNRAKIKEALETIKKIDHNTVSIVSKKTGISKSTVGRHINQIKNGHTAE